MQLRDGSFSFWPNSDWSSDWGSVYAANFLVEARSAGHTVSDRVYERMLSYLWRLGKKRSDYQWSLQLRTYALYVLSLAQKPQTSSMAYIKNQRVNDLYPDARTFLAAAYYYAGDKKTARELLPTTFAAGNLTREKGGNFNSSVRTDAICLGLLADVDPKNPAVPKLMARLAETVKAERWSTSQENAFAFMAMGKILKNRENADYSGEISVNGRSIGSFDSKNREGIPPEFQKICCEASAGSDVRKLYWFIDRQLLGVVAPGERLFYVPAAGRHRVVCQDDYGRSTEFWLVIEKAE